jgi:hypothetical protein
MAFTIQKEEDLTLNISVQTDNDGSFALVPETPHLVSSTFANVLIHVPAFANNIIGNNVVAQNNGIYLVSLEANGDLSINQVGG